MRFSAKAGWRLGAFGDPGSGAEKVTTGLAPSLAQTPMKNHHKSQPAGDSDARSVSLWLSSGVAGRESCSLEKGAG